MKNTPRRATRPENFDFFSSPPAPSALGHIRRLWKLLRASHAPRGRFVGSIVLTTAVSFCSLFLFSLLFPLAEGLISRDFSAVRQIHGLKMVIAAFPALFQSQTALFLALVAFTYLVSLTKSLAGYAADILILRQAAISSERIRQQVFERYLLFGKSFFDRHNMSDLNEKLMLSSRIIFNQFMAFQALLSQSMALIVFLTCMLWISWPLTVVVLIIFPLISLANNRVKRRLRRISAEASRATTELTKRIGSILAGISLVKGYGKEDREKARFLAISNEEVQKTFLLESQRKLLVPLNDMSATTGILMVAIAITSFSVFSGSIAPGHLFVFLYVALKTVPALNSLNTFAAMIASDSGLMRSLEEIFQAEDDAIVPDGTLICTGLKARIEFKNVHFAYQHRSPALAGVNFTLEKGRMTALVGGSGSGKTTLFNLLLRFYDCPPDSIFVDGTDIRHFSIASLRTHFSFVSQDLPIFDDTIRANICYAQSHVSEARLEEVCRKARIYDFIQSLPQGFETMVGERGTRLSGGEKQRLAVARAFLREADIVLLDEVTSALDEQTASLVSEAIAELTAEKTVLIIAHNLSTIARADHVVLLEHGRITKQGTPTVILGEQTFSHAPIPPARA